MLYFLHSPLFSNKYGFKINVLLQSTTPYFFKENVFFLLIILLQCLISQNVRPIFSCIIWCIYWNLNVIFLWWITLTLAFGDWTFWNIIPLCVDYFTINLHNCHMIWWRRSCKIFLLIKKKCSFNNKFSCKNKNIKVVFFFFFSSIQNEFSVHIITWYHKF